MKALSTGHIALPMGKNCEEGYLDYHTTKLVNNIAALHSRYEYSAWRRNRMMKCAPGSGICSKSSSIIKIQEKKIITPFILTKGDSWVHFQRKVSSYPIIIQKDFQIYLVLSCTMISRLCHAKVRDTMEVVWYMADPLR